MQLRRKHEMNESLLGITGNIQTGICTSDIIRQRNLQKMIILSDLMICNFGPGEVLGTRIK